MELPFDFEILVINDFENKTYFEDRRVIELFNPNGGVAKSRNLGVNTASYEKLLLIDDDMIVNKSSILWIFNQLDHSIHNALNVDWVYPPELRAKAQKTKFGRYLLTQGHASSRRMDGQR